MYDCLIIGLGPVGAILGNLLGKSGLKVCILEQATEIFPHPRAIHGDDEMLRTIQSVGLLNDILPHIQPFEQMELLSKIGKLLIKIDLADPAKPNGFPTDFWFFQPKLEEVLRKGLERFPNVETRLGVSVHSIQQNESEVEVTIASRLDNSQNPTEKEILKAKYLVGCDGGNSFTRKQMGGKLLDLGFNQKWLVADCLEKEIGEWSEPKSIWKETHQQILNPKQPITYVCGAERHRRWEVMEMGSGKPSAETVLERLDLEKNYEFIRKADYSFHALIAEKWQFGRVFLCGDAAHQMPPFLGQGLCSGFRDAENLAWKLELVLGMEKESEKSNFGNASWEILETYQSERYLHTLNLIKGAIFLGKVIQTTNSFVAGIRNLFLRSIRDSKAIKQKIQNEIVKKENLESGFLQANKHKLVGSLFPQFRTKQGNQIIYSDEKFGKYFTVIGTGKIADFTENNSLISYLEIEDLEMRKWFAKHRIVFAIVRPDKRIFGCGEVNDFEKSVSELSEWISGGNF